MSEQSWNAWFDTQLDLLANGLPFESTLPKQSNGTPPVALLSDLQMAAHLANLNLAAESKTQANLRTRLAWMAMVKVPPAKARNRSVRAIPHSDHLRASWLAGLAAVFMAVCLMIFNQPVLAMVQHILGYGYLSEVGFFPLSNTQLLKGPVELRQNERQVLVRQGISRQVSLNGSGATWLWLEGAPETLSLADTWLELPQSSIPRTGMERDLRMPALSIDPTGSSQSRLAFGVLPAGTTQAMLHLSEGWQIPLEWIQAADAGLVPTQVSVPTATHAPTGSAPITPCLNVSDPLQICVQAGLVDGQKTHLLLELQTLQNGIGLFWDANMNNKVELRDENRTIYPLEAALRENTDVTGAVTLQFATLPAGISEVTLHLSGIQIQKDGKEEWIAGPFDLPLRLPARGMRISPTPAVIQTSERRPAPTPSLPSRP
jgi:hypothetical protein